MFHEKPELSVKIITGGASTTYPDGLQVGGIIWNSNYREYTVMIYQDMSKAQSTPIDDVALTFDFNTSIISLCDQYTVGVTNPTIQLSQATVISTNTTNVPEIRPLQVTVDLERLKPGGSCAFSVILDPKYAGGVIRNIIIGENVYRGSYRYEIMGRKLFKNNQWNNSHYLNAIYANDID